MAHPEQQPGEVFLTNSWPDHFPHLSDWRTKRRGLRAFDLAGSVMPDMFPVFVQESEVLEKRLDLEAMRRRANSYSSSSPSTPIQKALTCCCDTMGIATHGGHGGQVKTQLKGRLFGKEVVITLEGDAPGIYLSCNELQHMMSATFMPDFQSPCPEFGNCPCVTTEANAAKGDYCHLHHRPDIDLTGLLRRTEE